MTQEQRDKLAESMDRATTLKGHAHNALRSVVWFALPFGVMWGAGLAVEDAARMAVAPWACAGVTIALTSMSLAFVGHMVVTTAKAAE